MLNLLQAAMGLSVHQVCLPVSLLEQGTLGGCRAQDRVWRSGAAGVPGWVQDMVKSGRGMGSQVQGMAK